MESDAINGQTKAKIGEQWYDPLESPVWLFR